MPLGRSVPQRRTATECHEELLHNPVFTPQDVANFARLVAARGFSEKQKDEGRDRLLTGDQETGKTHC